MKLYLDEQPEIQAIIKEFMEDLTPDYDYGYKIGSEEVEEIECRSRSGFIPHSHNCGGYDKQWITDLMSIWGSGIDCGQYTPDYANKVYEEALEVYFRYDISNEDKALLNTIPEDKHNYNDLQELGYTELAETIDEYCHEWLRTDTIYYGYRAMYEGKKGAWHTLMIYACHNRSEYYHAFAGETLVECEIKFRNAKELKEKLDKCKSELESAF